MTEGLCPHCGKWFKSLEIHLGKCSESGPKTMREIQKMLKKPKKRP